MRFTSGESEAPRDSGYGDMFAHSKDSAGKMRAGLTAKMAMLLTRNSLEHLRVRREFFYKH